jgi:hypothetical protein
MVCGETGAVTLQSYKTQVTQAAAAAAAAAAYTGILSSASVLKSHQIDPGEVVLSPHLFESRKGWR